MNKPYEVINLEQGSPEWLQYRREHVGSSDMKAIMGCGYHSAYKTWLEKLGFSEESYESTAIRRGKTLEPIARMDFICQTGFTEMMPVVLHSLRESHLMASMDAADLCKDIAVEIKVPVPESKFHEMALDGIVPPMHMPQLQSQMFVMGIEMIYFFSWHENSSKIIEVPYDEEYVKNLIQKSKEFHECVKTWNPPPLTAKDHVERRDLEWTSTASRLKEIQEKKKVLETEEEFLRGKLIGLSGNHSCTGGGISVTKIVSKGKIDYKSAMKKNSIDPEPYRNPPTSYWRVS